MNMFRFSFDFFLSLCSPRFSLLEVKNDRIRERSSCFAQRLCNIIIIIIIGLVTPAAAAVVADQRKGTLNILYVCGSYSYSIAIAGANAYSLMNCLQCVMCMGALC